MSRLVQIEKKGDHIVPAIQFKIINLRVKMQTRKYSSEAFKKSEMQF